MGSERDGQPRFESCPGGFPGKCFVPASDGPRKHPCRDCFACQWCSDERCAVCLARQHTGQGPLPPQS